MKIGASLSIELKQICTNFFPIDMYVAFGINLVSPSHQPLSHQELKFRAMQDYTVLRDSTLSDDLQTKTQRPLSPNRDVSRPPTSSGRSANAIIKEASALVACSELQLPSIIGTNSRMLAAVVTAALQVEVDVSSVVGVELPSGLYISCRNKDNREKMFVILKGRQFLAPSSAELQNILDEAMTFMIMRNSTPSPELIQRFPAVARQELYRGCEKIFVVTLVKDHLESSFHRTEQGQFHYPVAFSDLWSNLCRFHFFSLRHFSEAIERLDVAPVTHPFRHWLFLFAFQGRISSTKVEGNDKLQKLCDEAIGDESIAIAWERAAELSRGPSF